MGAPCPPRAGAAERPAPRGLSVAIAHRTRREFIGLGVGGVAVTALGATFWNDIFGAATHGRVYRGPGYGPRGGPDDNGIRLPAGFSSRVVAQGSQRVPGTDYTWHIASDGAAAFPISHGGWILVSNSETTPGGASAIRFKPDGSIADAYRILDGTAQNCSGGATPWGTWLSCEEVQNGNVYECDPTGRRKAVVRPAMGVFKHEAAAVDPRGRHVYMTEDWENGGFYRFSPRRWPDLSQGTLEIARFGSGGRVTWARVPDPSGMSAHTRHQVKGSAKLARAEGIWFDDGIIYLTTTLDSRVRAYDTGRSRVKVIYDGLAAPAAPLNMVDQLTASRVGELFVAEDNNAADIDVGLIDRRRRVSRFLTLTGKQHAGSEATGLAFDPSGRRLYVSSQRGHGGGVIYEIRGPFHGARV
jgi:secreted PhoX family phosphatase